MIVSAVGVIDISFHNDDDDDDYDDDYHNSVPERYRSVFFLHNRVYMPKKLFYCFWRSISWPKNGWKIVPECKICTGADPETQKTWSCTGACTRACFFTYSGLYAQRLILLFNIILILDAPVHALVQLYVIMMMIWDNDVAERISHPKNMMIECLLKTLKLAVWALSSNFVHDFTLFVIKIHQNRFISPLLTTGDHFHFRQIWDCFDTITVCPIFLRE